MISMCSFLLGRELPCTAFQDHKQPQGAWLHYVFYVLVPCQSLLLDCMSKQFQCLLPMQDAALFHLLRLQDTFVCFFKKKTNQKTPSPAYVCGNLVCLFVLGSFLLSLFCNIYKRQFLREALTGLSCLPMTCGRKFLLRDSPPRLIWDSSLLHQAPLYWHVQHLTAPLPHRSPNTLKQHPSLKPKPPPWLIQFPLPLSN